MLPAADLGAALTQLVLPRLSAAAHGNIFLFQLPRIAPRGRAGVMARGLVRELARHPEWNLTWHLDRSTATADDLAEPADRGDELVDALLRPRSPGPLDTNFIFPTMSLVEQSGLAAELLDQPTRAIGLRSARRALLRVAAWSMLQDDPDQAPYGWSHCLTLPQAALGVAPAATDPADAIAVAATYVLGFRATLGRVTLDPGWVPEPLDIGDDADRLDALAGRPDEAAAATWHAAEPIVAPLVARARRLRRRPPRRPSGQVHRRLPRRGQCRSRRRPRLPGGRGVPGRLVAAAPERRPPASRTLRRLTGTRLAGSRWRRP